MITWHRNTISSLGHSRPNICQPSVVFASISSSSSSAATTPVISTSELGGARRHRWYTRLSVYALIGFFATESDRRTLPTRQRSWVCPDTDRVLCNRKKQRVSPFMYTTSTSSRLSNCWTTRGNRTISPTPRVRYYVGAAPPRHDTSCPPTRWPSAVLVRRRCHPSYRRASRPIDTRADPNGARRRS